MMLWNRLRESLVELPKDVADGARPILDFARRPNAPVVIRLDGVPVHALASENGGDPADTLERIEQFLQDKLFLVMCGQSNFELLEPVSVRETDVFRVVEHWDSAEKEPLLTPYSPTGAPVATKA
jgi:hypothetical protein